jgi:hypothetical protein
MISGTARCSRGNLITRYLQMTIPVKEGFLDFYGRKVDIEIMRELDMIVDKSRKSIFELICLHHSMVGATLSSLGRLCGKSPSFHCNRPSLSINTLRE